jgi:hypothetical protein
MYCNNATLCFQLVKSSSNFWKTVLKNILPKPQSSCNFWKIYFRNLKISSIAEFGGRQTAINRLEKCLHGRTWVTFRMLLNTLITDHWAIFGQFLKIAPAFMPWGGMQVYRNEADMKHGHGTFRTYKSMSMDTRIWVLGFLTNWTRST